MAKFFQRIFVPKKPMEDNTNPNPDPVDETAARENPPSEEKTSLLQSIVAYFFKIVAIARKFFSEFFVMFISISASFSLSEWNRANVQEYESKLGLLAIQTELRLDTANFTRTIAKLDEAAPALLEAMNGAVQPTDLHKLQKLLQALRAYHGIGVQKTSVRHVPTIAQDPSIQSRALLHRIGVYHERSTFEGNFGGFNKDYSDIAFENHKKLFETFPNYLHPDTLVANQSILDGAQAFLQNPYWKARIGLTYRQITSYNKPVYIKHKELATTIIREIEKELQYHNSIWLR